MEYMVFCVEGRGYVPLY